MSTSACKAVCTIISDAGSTSVLGHLVLAQADASAPTTLSGNLSGLTPGKHGISVCVQGDLSQGGGSCGPIFNPFGKTHGSPEDESRMVGDLGNILVDEAGNCAVDIKDNKLVQLLGPHSVLGRSIVIYAGEDDLGRGGHENSGTTGNSGPRIAAGVIGLAA